MNKHFTDPSALRSLISCWSIYSCTSWSSWLHRTSVMSNTLLSN